MDGINGAQTFGVNGVQMLRDLKRSKFLPPYHEASMRKVIQEVDLLFKTIAKTLETQEYEVNDPSVACGLVVHHQSLLRNKRCALAYLKNRLTKIKRVYWETGMILPDDIKSCLSPHEVDFFKNYSRLVAKYSSDVDIDLTSDQVPPKDLFVEVRCVDDCGQVQTESGVIHLEKNSTVYVKRLDVVSLLKQGSVKQIQ